MNEELNLPCLYKVYLIPGLPFYTFTTDFNIEYNIVFDEDVNLFEDTSVHGFVNHIYSLNLIKATNIKSKHDPEVRVTVEAIISHFFDNPYNTLVFYCDSSDDKEDSRQSLFDQWYKNSDQRDTIIKLDNSIETGYRKMHSSIIFRVDNPQAHYLHQGFEELELKYKK